MKFCSKCGNELTSASNYCASCGQKVNSNNENKIDSSIEHIKKNISSVKNEISESQTIKDLNTSINRNVRKTSAKIIDFLGIVGLVVILSQIFLFFAIDKVFLFQEAFEKHISSTNYLTNYIEKYVNFIAEIIPSTILPFVFMFISGLRKKWLLITSCILVILIFLLSITGKGNSRFKKEDSLNDSTSLVNETNVKPYKQTEGITTLYDSINDQTIIENSIREKYNLIVPATNRLGNSIDLSFIMKYKNQYAFDDICESEEFSNELKTKFGDNLYDMFIKYIAVQSPIRIKSNKMFASACFSHSCGFNESALFIDLNTNHYYAGILNEEDVYLISNDLSFDKNDFQTYPNEIINWLYKK